MWHVEEKGYLEVIRYSFQAGSVEKALEAVYVLLRIIK
jgi:hypothetical protein